MSLMGSAVLLLWVVTVLLVLALTGVLRQLRQLQQVVFGPSTPSLAGPTSIGERRIVPSSALEKGANAELKTLLSPIAADGRDRLLIFVRPGCISCDYLLSSVPGLADLGRDYLTIVVVGTDVPEALRQSAARVISADPSSIESARSQPLPAVIVANQDGDVMAGDAAEAVALLERRLPADMFEEVRRRVA